MSNPLATVQRAGGGIPCPWPTVRGTGDAVGARLGAPRTHEVPEPLQEVTANLRPILLARLTPGFPVASTTSIVAPSAKQGHLDAIPVLQAFAAKSSVSNELKLLTDC